MVADLSLEKKMLQEVLKRIKARSAACLGLAGSSSRGIETVRAAMCVERVPRV